MSADISWSAPAVTLTAEYLFVQLEWVIDVAGTASGDDVRFYISLCSFTAPPPSSSIPNATALVTGSLIFGTPTVVDVPFTANPLTTGHPIFATPTLHQKQILAASPLVIGHPIFATPLMNLTTYVLTAVPLTLGNPAMGTPYAAVLRSIPNATALVTGSLIFGTPTVVQLPFHLTTGRPIFGTPDIGGTNFLTAVSLVIGVPGLGIPGVHQVYSAVTQGVSLPSSIEHGAKGGPRFNTSLFIGANGAEYRSVNWQRSVGTWAISLGYRDDDRNSYDDFQQLLNVFYVSRGNGYGFLFKDWSDYAAVDQPMALIPGSGGAMQLQKVYSVGVGSYARRITRPVVSSVVITLDGAPQGGISISPGGGVILGANSSMRASFQFVIPVRFDIDALEIDVEVDGLVNCPSINLVEVME
jgi:uncharacterized protein (TIGR02217 family)